MRGEEQDKMGVKGGMVVLREEDCGKGGEKRSGIEEEGGRRRKRKRKKGIYSTLSTILVIPWLSLLVHDIIA